MLTFTLCIECLNSCSWVSGVPAWHDMSSLLLSVIGHGVWAYVDWYLMKGFGPGTKWFFFFFRQILRLLLFSCSLRGIWQKRKSTQRCGELILPQLKLLWCPLVTVYYIEVDSCPIFWITASDQLFSSYRWLYRDGLLPNETYFVGFARSDLTVQDIRTACLPYMKVCPVIRKLSSILN